MVGSLHYADDVQDLSITDMPVSFLFPPLSAIFFYSVLTKLPSKGQVGVAPGEVLLCSPCPVL